MGEITIKYTSETKMSDLIGADYRLLLLLARLGFPLGFGSMTVETVCHTHGFNTDCFLFLANLQSNKPAYNYQDAFDKIPLELVLDYLQQSHDYFLKKRLPQFRGGLENTITGLDKAVQAIILRFMDDYANEVKEHMEYENETAFPYVKNLISHHRLDTEYTITDFETHHSDIEGKMNDLSRLLVKYVQGGVDYMKMTNVLIDLHMLQEELDSHTFIENKLVIPRVKKLEAGCLIP